jgi:hypothetical protein
MQSPEIRNNQQSIDYGESMHKANSAFIHRSPGEGGTSPFYKNTA